MSRFSQSSIAGKSESYDDYDDRGTAHRQSVVRTASMSTSSSRSSINSGTTRSSRTVSYSESSKSRESSYRDSYRDSTYSTETRSSTTSSLVQAEIRDLENMILKFKDQLDSYRRTAEEERRRADDAVRKAHEFAEHLKKVNEARLIAVQEANQAHEALRLYKIQLEYAQNEINRAQDVLEVVDKQRYNAEKEAAEAEARARRLWDQLLVEQARKEGRQQGMEEGLLRGRTLNGPDLIRPMAGERSSFINRASFMESEFSSSDTITLSSRSSRSSRSSIHSTRTKSSAHHDPTPPPRAPSPQPAPAPIPVPRPARPASEIMQMRAPSPAPSKAPSHAPTHRSTQRPPSHSPSPVPSHMVDHNGLPPRPCSRPSSAARTEVPDTRHQPSAPPSNYEASPRPRSKAPSIAPSEAPPSSIHNPSPRASPQPSPQPSPRPSPRPSPLPLQPPIIPPDNWIPVLGPDGIISLPPPHEFVAAAHRGGSPNPYTNATLSDDTSHHQHQRQSSIDSASTGGSHWSYHEAPRDHHAHVYATPALSAIPEVSSIAPTPNIQGQDMQHQRSMGAVSGRSGYGYDGRSAQGSALGMDFGGGDYAGTAYSRTPGSAMRPLDPEKTPGSVARSIGREASPARSAYAPLSDRRSVVSSHRDTSPARSAQPLASDIRSSVSRRDASPARSARPPPDARSTVSSRRDASPSGKSAHSSHVNVQPPSKPASVYSAKSRTSANPSSQMSININVQTPSASHRSEVSPPVSNAGGSNIGGSHVGAGVMPGGMDGTVIDHSEDDQATHVSYRDDHATRASYGDDQGTHISQRPRDDESSLSSGFGDGDPLATPQKGRKNFTPPPQSTVSSVTAVSAKSKAKGKKGKGKGR